MTSNAEVILQTEPCEPIDLTLDEADDSLDNPDKPVYLASDAEPVDFSEDSDVDGDLDDGSKYLNEENSRKIISFLAEKEKEWEEKRKKQKRPSRYAKGVPLDSRPLSTQRNIKNKLKKEIAHLESSGQLFISKIFKTSGEPKLAESLKTSETKKRLPFMEEEEEEEEEEEGSPNQDLFPSALEPAEKVLSDAELVGGLTHIPRMAPIDRPVFEEEEEEDLSSQGLFRSVLKPVEKVLRNFEPVGGSTHIPRTASQGRSALGGEEEEEEEESPPI